MYFYPYFIVGTSEFFSSQFEEKFEEMNGVEPPASLPLASSSGSNEHLTAEMTPLEHNGKGLESQTQLSSHTCSDLNASPEFGGGIMRIVPSDVDVSLSSCSICSSSEALRKIVVNLQGPTMVQFKNSIILLFYLLCLMPHGTVFFSLQNDADYWLLSDADVSITDMWRTDCIRHLFTPALSLSSGPVSFFG